MKDGIVKLEDIDRNGNAWFSRDYNPPIFPTIGKASTEEKNHFGSASRERDIYKLTTGQPADEPTNKYFLFYSPTHQAKVRIKFESGETMEFDTETQKDEALTFFTSYIRNGYDLDIFDLLDSDMLDI
jgi:hypothetical protein